MPKSGNDRKFVFTFLFCAVIAASGCGRNETASPSENEHAPSSAHANSAQEPAELPIDQQTEQKLEPLTKDDVELYLRVMRAAADRVKNPTPADRATMESAKNIFARSAAGRLLTAADVKTLEQSNLVAISMDQLIAMDMKLDGRTYRGIAEAVESVVPNPMIGIASGNKNLPRLDRAPTPLERRISEVNFANEKFLVPARDEIQKLISVVHNPARLPK